MKQPLYQNLYLQVREEILSGRISDGMRLPSIRQMTRDYSVSRTTVETAYEQLCADGLVTCVPQSGYYVNSLPKRPSRAEQAPLSCPPQTPEIRYDFSGKTLDAG